MPSISSDARFLGVDLKALWLDLRQSWQQLHYSPLALWLTPEPAVLLLQVDGDRSLWRGDVNSGVAKDAGVAAFVAIELPEARVLQRSLSMPAAMSAADLAQAVALEVRTSSPFVAYDLAWGYRAHAPRQGTCQVDLVLASQRQIAQYLTEQANRLNGLPAPEVWAFSPQGHPLVLRGFGEALRHAFAARHRRLGYGLLALALSLGIALAATPTLQLRMRAMEAMASHDALTAHTAPVVRQRELLLQSAEHMNGLAELLVDRMEPLRVLEKITNMLPDDTALQSFRLQGAKVMLSGLTSNTASLLQLLGEQAGLREVRSPSAATRMGSSGKENFSIELVLDPEIFGVPKSAAIGLVTLTKPEPASTPQTILSPIPLPDEAHLSTFPSAKPVARTNGQATSGGGAVFGGSPARSAASNVPSATATAPASVPVTSSTPVARTVP